MKRGRKKTTSRGLPDLAPKKDPKGGVLIGLNQPSLPAAPTIGLCPSDPSLNFKK